MHGRSRRMHTPREPEEHPRPPPSGQRSARLDVRRRPSRESEKSADVLYRRQLKFRLLNSFSHKCVMSVCFFCRMPMLSVVPGDTILAVAIKDATMTTSTANPARITTAVQKMRPVSRRPRRFPLCSEWRFRSHG